MKLSAKYGQAKPETQMLRVLHGSLLNISFKFPLVNSPLQILVLDSKILFLANHPQKAGGFAKGLSQIILAR